MNGKIVLARTEAEIKAYVDGYNACFNHMMECFKGQYNKANVIDKMQKYLAAVNAVVDKEVDSE